MEDKLGAKKINLSASLWNLKRIQCQAENPRTIFIQAMYDNGLRALDLALDKNLLTQEAYRWAKDNDIRIAIWNDEIFGVIIMPQAKEDL